MKTPVFGFFLDADETVFRTTKEFANLSDYQKLQSLNAAMELIMRQTNSIIISLEVQKENALGDHPRAQ
jgi:hypothetical protein